MSISNYAENAILDAVFNNTSLAVAANYVKLHTGDPGEAGTSNAATHTTRESASFGAASSGVVSNDSPISFTSLAADETISHISIWDHVSAGNCLWTGALTDPQDVNAGGTLTFDTGDLDVSLD